jgi:hypothetical protein
MAFEGVPYLYQNKNGSFRVLAKGVDEYFKATEKAKAVKFAKGLQKDLGKQLKGFLTRQELGEKLGIKDVTIERAKQVDSRLWKEISNQMEIKKVGNREYYKFKGKEKNAISSIKKFSGAEAFKGPRDVYAGKVTIAGKIRKLLKDSKDPLNVKEIENKLPKGTPIGTINSALADLKKDVNYKDKIKKITLQESVEAGAVTKRKASAPYIVAVRNAFVNDPDATTADVAEEMFGTNKYKSASRIDKLDMDQIARLNIIKFVQEVGGKGSNIPIPGFKDIAPDKLGDIIESIESRSNTFGFEPGERKRFQQAVADSLRSLPVNYTEKLKAKLKGQAGMAVDEVNPTASVFKQAPGYIEATQVIPFKTNQIKGTTLDALFGKTFKKVMQGDFSGVDYFNQKSAEFAKKYNIDTPIIRTGSGLNPEDYVSNFSDYTKSGQENIRQLAKEKDFVLETKSKPLQLLANARKDFENNTDNICSIFGKANGGSVKACLTSFDNAVKNNPQSLFQKIINFAKSPGVKTFGIAGTVGAVGAQVVKEFRNDDPTSYLSNEDQQKSMLVSMATDPITTEFDRPAILDYQLPALGATVAGATALGAPSTIKASRSRALGVEKKGLTRTGARVLGRGLGLAATPAALLPFAAADLAGQIAEGDSAVDIATDPINYLAPIFADKTDKITRGLNPTLRKLSRLNLGKAALRGISRGGIAGLGLSLGIEGLRLLDD